MIKEILTYPNDILTQKARVCIPVLSTAKRELEDLIPQVNFPWDPEVIQTVEDLKDTAEHYADVCLGLSACQIWDSNTPPPAIFVVKFPKAGSKHEWMEFINPHIHTSGNKIKLKEGCLSMPGFTKIVSREMNATVTFQTIDDVNPKQIKYFGKQTFVSMIVQHEYDHLCGKLLRR